MYKSDYSAYCQVKFRPVPQAHLLLLLISFVLHCGPDFRRLRMRKRYAIKSLSNGISIEVRVVLHGLCGYRAPLCCEQNLFTFPRQNIFLLLKKFPF